MRQVIAVRDPDDDEYRARVRRIAASLKDRHTNQPTLWQKYRPRWNTRDKLTFWLPLGIVCVAAVCAAYWTELKSATVTKVSEVRNAVVTHPEFAVKRLEIIGRRETSRNFVLAALDINGSQSSISSLELDVAEARERLIRSPWIDDASVALDPGGTLRLSLEERTPAAIWRANGEYWLIDSEGELIDTIDGPGERLDLPYLLGQGADDAVGEARSLLLSAPPHVVNEMLALVRRGGRRWDVVSKHGFVLKLPEEDALNALRSYGRSNLGERLKSRAVISLDLRRPGEPPVLAMEPGMNSLRLEALAELRKPDPTR